jgi:hypothetical protein
MSNLNTESGQKPRKRARLTGIFKRNKKTPAEPVPTSSTPFINQGSSDSSVEESKDRQATKARYAEAAKLLENAVKGREKRWGSFELPELTGEPKDSDDLEFKEKLHLAFEAQRSKFKDQSAWAKSRRFVECIFTALSPFAKTFLHIAKEGQSVSALLLVAGNILTIYNRLLY